jgi:hypothetical protein
MHNLPPSAIFTSLAHACHVGTIIFEKTNQLKTTMNNERKDWWAPVWTGLVMDPECTHYTRMKSALWLYIYLLLNADRKTGSLKRKLRTISLDTGIKERTVKQWLSILKKNGYVEARSTGRCVYLVINKWKNTRKAT